MSFRLTRRGRRAAPPGAPVIVRRPTVARPRWERWAPLGISVLVTVAFARVMWPFFGAILWAIVFAVVFRPLQARLTAMLRGAPTLAAWIALAIIVGLVLVPIGLIGSAVLQEMTHVVAELRAGRPDVTAFARRGLALLPASAGELLRRLGAGDPDGLQQRLADELASVGQSLATHLLSVGQVTVHLVTSVFLMLYLLFFLLRDGPELTARIGAAVPLAQRHKQGLGRRMASVVRATVKGNLAIATLQGGLGAAGLVVAGVGEAALAGAVIALASLVPAIGAALAWLPIVAYVAASGGAAMSLALLAYGAFVVAVVDNLLRPWLVGRDAGMPDFLVLVSTLGGLAALGVSGLVVGPVVAALFIAVWERTGIVRR